MAEKISLQEGLNRLLDHFNEIKKIPTKKEFKEHKWSPSYDWYSRHFENNFLNACYACGICEKPLNDKERIQLSINNLIELANELNRCPTVNEYDSIKSDKYLRRVLERKLNMKYNDICRKYIPKYELNHMI